MRGQDVYLVQTMCSPLHENIFELLVMIDTLKRDSAGRINVVIPYLSYARSDKKDQPRVGIAARLLANMIEVAGADRYITIDLHAGQIQGFFNIPGDALTGFHLVSDYVIKKQIENLVVVSADLGFAKKGRNWAEKLGTPLAIVEKRRTANDAKSEALSIIGDVRDKNVLLVDDEVLTGGSVANAVNLVKQEGALDVYLAFTHPLLAEQAADRLAELPIKEIITTNTRADLGGKAGEAAEHDGAFGCAAAGRSDPARQSGAQRRRTVQRIRHAGAGVLIGGVTRNAGRARRRAPTNSLNVRGTACRAPTIQFVGITPC